MEKISSTDELNEAIQLLEAEQAFKLMLMKQKFRQSYQSLHPANLIQTTLKEISASPYLVNTILSIVVGLAAGYVSKKAITGRSNNKLRRFLGIVLQMGITNIIAQNPKAIRSFGQYISHHIFHKEE